MHGQMMTNLYCIIYFILGVLATKSFVCVYIYLFIGYNTLQGSINFKNLSNLIYSLIGTFFLPCLVPRAVDNYPVRTLTATTDLPHTWHSLTGEAARKTVSSESTVGLSRGRRAAKLPPPSTESTVKWKQCPPNSAKMSIRSPCSVYKPVRSSRNV